MKITRYIKECLKLLRTKEIKPIIITKDNSELLLGKVALITGGSSGIGLEIAKKFLSCGCKVVISGTNEEKMKKICNELNNKNLKYIVLNVLDVKKMPNKIAKVVDMFEEKRIDILVNSAGLVSKSSFFDMTEEEYDKIMDTNAKGTFFMSKYVGQYMIDNKIKGHILNLSSSSSLRPAWTPYQISKWAVKGLTLGLADIFIKHGIVVNAIAPGPTATPMLNMKDGDSIEIPDNPSGRYATPIEIANLAVFMASSMGDLIVGDTFYITGGSGTITYHN